MSSKFNITSKDFWKSRHGQLTFCALGGVLSVIVLLIQFGGSLGSIFPSEVGKAALERNIKKLQQNIEEMELEMKSLDNVRKQAESQLDGAWKAAEHGVPEVVLRESIEKAAKDLDLRLNNISTVRRNSFNETISLLEVDVSLSADLDMLMKFLTAVEQIKPQLYWKRFDCRMVNMFGVNGVMFNGTLRCANDETSLPPPQVLDGSGNAVTAPPATENSAAVANTPAAAKAPATAESGVAK